MPKATELRPHCSSRADGRARTDDLLITNQLLYQLSYVSTATKVSGFTPPIQARFQRAPPGVSSRMTPAAVSSPRI